MPKAHRRGSIHYPAYGLAVTSIAQGALHVATTSDTIDADLPIGADVPAQYPTLLVPTISSGHIVSLDAPVPEKNYPNLLVRTSSGLHKVHLPVEFRKCHKLEAEGSPAATEADVAPPEDHQDPDEELYARDVAAEPPAEEPRTRGSKFSTASDFEGPGRPFHDYLTAQLGQEVATVTYNVREKSERSGPFGRLNRSRSDLSRSSWRSFSSWSSLWSARSSAPVQEVELAEPKGEPLAQYPFVGGMEIRVAFAEGAPPLEAARSGRSWSAVEPGINPRGCDDSFATSAAEGLKLKDSLEASSPTREQPSFGSKCEVHASVSIVQ